MRISSIATGLALAGLCVGCSQVAPPTAPTSINSTAVSGLVAATSETGESVTADTHEVPFKGDLEGTVTGKTIKFSIKVDAQGTPLTIVYDGEIESNTAMKGKVDLGGVGTGTFTGKRTK